VSRQPGARRRLADLAGTNPDRLAGISDGIFSVGMTLLVLGLVVPALYGSATTEGQLWQWIRNLAPNVLVYTMSFITLGIFWLGQGTQIAHLARSNRNFVWIHLGFLFFVTMVPFSTALLAHFYWLKIALVEYWLNIVMLGAALFWGLEYGLRAKLFREEDVQDIELLMRGRILIAQSLYAGATLLCLVLPTWVSITLIILIQLNYVLAPRIPILGRF
jgi:uncharacterized membrane protein